MVYVSVSRPEVRAVRLILALALAAATSPLAAAGATECGARSVAASFSTPAPAPAELKAADALGILRSAVGSIPCELCVCDVDNSGAIRAADALRVLRVAVGQTLTVSCPACLPPATHPTGTVAGFLYRKVAATPTALGSAESGAESLAIDVDPFVIGPDDEAPDGTAPVSGAVVVVEGAKTGTTTNADGGFELDVPAGQRRLRVDHSGTDRRLPLTVVADTTLVLGDQQRSREAAIDLVEEEVIDELPTPAAAFVAGSQQPLPAGTILSTEDPLGRDVFQETVLDEPAWLFYVDEYPAASFGHPVRHVLVGDETGAVTVLDRSYWPRLNDVDLWRSIEERQGDDTVALPTARLDPPKGLGASYAVTVAPSDPPLHAIPGCNASNSQTFLLTIRGTDGESIFLEAAEKMNAAVQPSAQASVVPLFAESFATVMNSAFATLNAQMDPCDTLVVYVTSHGGWDDEEGNQATGSFQYKRTNASLGRFQTQWIGGSELLLPLRTLKACHLLMILDTCYAGSFLEPKRGNGIVVSSRVLPKGLHALFLAAADSKTTSEYAPISLGNTLFGTATGSLFSNQLIASGLLAPGAIGLDNVSAKFGPMVADVADSPAKKQGASKFERPADPEAPCGTSPCTTETEPNDDEESASALEPDAGDSEAACASGEIEEAMQADHDFYKALLPPGSYVINVVGGASVMIYLPTGPPIEGEKSTEFDLDELAEVFFEIFGPTGPYVLQLLLLEPIDVGPMCVQEVEPDDACFLATPLEVSPQGEACGFGEIPNFDDLDHFTGLFSQGGYTVTVTDGSPFVFVDTGSGEPLSGPSPLSFDVGMSGANVCIGFFGELGGYEFVVEKTTN